MKSLRRSLIAVLALTTAVLLAGGWWFHHSQERSLRQEGEKELETIASSKVDTPDHRVQPRGTGIQAIGELLPL